MKNELECCTDEPQGVTARITRTFLSGPHALLFLAATAVIGVVPETSISHAGQLEYVQAVLNGQERPVLIRTIPASRGLREVVSGLETGMTIRARP